MLYQIMQRKKESLPRSNKTLTLLLPAANVDSFSRSGLLLDGKGGGTHLK
jgi:hypothetical protein